MVKQNSYNFISNLSSPVKLFPTLFSLSSLFLILPPSSSALAFSLLLFSLLPSSYPATSILLLLPCHGLYTLKPLIYQYTKGTFHFFVHISDWISACEDLFVFVFTQLPCHQLLTAVCSSNHRLMPIIMELLQSVGFMHAKRQTFKNKPQEWFSCCLLFEKWQHTVWEEMISSAI